MKAADDFGLPGELLNFGAGARPLAMGRAFTAVSDDVNSIFANPAGMSTYRSNQILFQYTPLPLGGAHQALAYTQPLRSLGSWGFGIVHLNSGDVPRIDGNNIENGNYDSLETAYILSHSYLFRKKVSLGGSLKLVEKSVDDKKAQGYGADLGALWLPREDVRVGAVIRNLVPPSYSFASEKEKFPAILRVGSSVSFFDKILTTAFDLDKTIGKPQGLKWHFGAEGRILENLFLRVGVDQTEFTSGAGFRWRAFQIDYAAGIQNLGLVNRTSLQIAFGGYEADVRASPRVFSPQGIKNKTTFKISTSHRLRVVNWILTLRNAQGSVVRSFNGYDNPPRVLEWDGKDANGRIVPEGTYTYRMSVTDAKNTTELTPTRTLRVLSPTPFEIEAK